MHIVLNIICSSVKFYSLLKSQMKHLNHNKLQETRSEMWEQKLTSGSKVSLVHTQGI